MTDIRVLEADYETAPVEGDLLRFDGAIWVPTSGLISVGDIKMLLSNTAPTGYLILAGGTIGNASSGATLRANADTENLFTYLWNNLANAEAPVSTGRGASAAEDFDLNKTITLPDSRQRFPIGKAASGTGNVLGGTGGTIDHTHTVPAHYHGMGTGADLNITSSGDHDHALPMNGAAGAQVTITPEYAGSVNNSILNTNTYLGDNGEHIHASGDIAGRIGLVTGGVNGNAAMTSGTGNPPFFTINFFIKY